MKTSTPHWYPAPSRDMKLAWPSSSSLRHNLRVIRYLPQLLHLTQGRQLSTRPATSHRFPRCVPCLILADAHLDFLQTRSLNRRKIFYQACMLHFPNYTTGREIVSEIIVVSFNIAIEKNLSALPSGEVYF